MTASCLAFEAATRRCGGSEQIIFGQEGLGSRLETHTGVFRVPKVLLKLGILVFKGRVGGMEVIQLRCTLSGRYDAA